MRHRIVLLFVAVALVLSGKEGERLQPDPSPAPPSGFGFFETGELFTRRALGPQATTVDYKSTVFVEPALAELAQDALPALTTEEKQEMQSLAALAQSLGHATNEWARVGRELESLTARRQKLSAAEIAVMQRELRDESRRRAAILSAIEKYARSMAMARTGKTDESDPAFLDEFARITMPLLQDSNGQAVILNAERVRDLFQNALRRYVQDSEDLKKAGTQVRIRAFLVTKEKQRIPIHVGNYDSIDNPLREQTDRVSFGSEQDRKRVAEEFKTASAIADFANAALSKKDGLQAALKGVVDAVKKDIDGLDAVFRDVLANPAVRAELSAALAELKNGLTTEQLQQIAAVEAFVAQADDLSKQIHALSQATLNEPSEIVGHAFSLLDAARRLQNGFAKVKPAAAIQGLSVLADVATQRLQAGANQPISPKMREWAETIFPNVRQALDTLNAAASRLSPLLDALQSAGSGARVASAGDDLVDTRLILQDLAVAPPGFVNLVNLADRGDKVEIRTELVSTGNRVTREYPARVFDVDKFGLSDTLSASVIFVNRVNRDSGADFVAAPSVSWTLHHRMPLAPDAKRVKRTIRFIDPGIGLSVAALNFDNSGVQIGLGGHVSLFRDLVQLGGGYNLNASDNNTYIFVGIGLFETLKQGSNLFGAR